MTTRALYRAVALPGAAEPFDRIAAKLYYPAAPSGSNEERNTGVVPADPSRAPLPVVILMPGINVGPESYAWLAKPLAAEGHLVVTYQLIAEEMPGYTSLTPGLRLDRLGADDFGSGPSATTVDPLLGLLRRENREPGPLNGMIDTQRVVMGGHSAGGTVALLNARSDWFPDVQGAFSYAAHTGAATMLGHPPNTLLPTGDVPVLVMGGTADGVIAASAGRYGDAPGDPTARVRDTFEQAVPPAGGNSHLVLLQGANHFSFAHPVDGTTGRPFLEDEATLSGDDARQVLARLVRAFCRERFEQAGETVEAVVTGHPGALAYHARK